MNTATIYRQIRKPFTTYTDDKGRHDWITPAKNALAIARDEIALRQAEADDRIRFEWEEDYYYEPDGDYDLEEEREKIRNGEYEALTCAAYVPVPMAAHACPSCECEPITTEMVAASLCGIVVDAADVHNYKREVERNLASEAGVI